MAIISLLICLLKCFGSQSRSSNEWHRCQPYECMIYNPVSEINHFCLVWSQYQLFYTYVNFGVCHSNYLFGRKRVKVKHPLSPLMQLFIHRSKWQFHGTSCKAFCNFNKQGNYPQQKNSFSMKFCKNV